MNKIVWLVSYPKSGNTWMRIFLANLISPNKAPIQINSLSGIPYVGHAASIIDFYRYTLLKHTGLKGEEIASLRPLVYEKLSASADDLLYIKTHDMYSTCGTSPLFPASASYGAIYMVRNPLDVLVSYAYYLDLSIDETISKMKDESYEIGKKSDKSSLQLPQMLSSWSKHLSSWTSQSEIPVLFIKYEDLIADPYQEFNRVVRFLKLDKSEQQIQEAINFSQFDQLKKQEDEKGFSEQPFKNKLFFRKGIVEDWKNMLSNSQIKEMRTAHEKFMIKYNYY